MISDELFVCLILTAPLYAAFTGMLFPVSRPVMTAVSLFWTGVSAFVLRNSEIPVKSIYFGRWLGGSIDESVSILLEFRFDQHAAFGIGLAGVCLLSAPLLSHFPATGTSRVPRSRSPESLLQFMILLTLCGLACTASDLMVIAALWMLMDILLTCRLSGTVSPADRSAQLGLLQLSSLLLLVAGLAVQARYQSVRIDDFLAASQSDTRIDADLVNSGLAVWIALSVCCRAAFFPWLLWLKRFSTHAGPLDLVTLPVGVLIPAGVLVMRMAPVLHNSSQASFLLSVLGALTAVVSAGIAAIQTRSFSAILILQVTAFALGTACCFQGSPAPSGLPPFVQMSALAGLGASRLCLPQRSPERFHFWPAVFFLFVTAVLTPGTSATVSMHDPFTVQSLITVCLALGQLLFSIALVRLLFRSPDTFHSARPDRSRDSHGTGRPPVSSGIFRRLISGPSSVVAVTVGLLVTVPLLADHCTALPTEFPGAVAVGLITGCVLFHRNSRLAAALKPAVGTGIRLSQTWWYLEQLSKGLVSMPGRIFSTMFRLFDHHLIGGAPEGTWMRHIRRLGGHVEFYRHLDPRYAALAGAACLAGLLIALVGIGD